MTRGKRLAAIVAGTLLGATALSEWATQDIAGRLEHDPALGQSIAGFYQPFAWVGWNQSAWAADVPRAFLPTRLGIIGAMLAGMGGVYAAARRRQRPTAYMTTHGTARFARQAEIRQAGLLGGCKGLYCGAWTDAKGCVHYLRHTGPEHLAAIAPTRSGKGVGLVVPNLLSWTGSTVVLDEKAELWELTAGWRKSIGQTVLRWRPGSPDNSCAFNPLDEVRLGTDHEVADAQNVAVMIVDADGKGLQSHWDRTAFALISGVILHVMYQHKAKGGATLTDVAQALSDPARPADKLYEAMADNRHAAGQRNDYVASAGREQINRAEKERSSVLSTATSYLKLFQDPIIARNCARSNFRIRDLMNAPNPVSLYVQLPGDDKLRLRPLARLLLTQITRGIVNAPILFDRSGRPIPPHRHEMLLMFDEFPSFGRLAVFEDALAKLAGYGVHAFLVMQDREQLIAAYGQHETILSNTGVLIAYAPNRYETAEWLSHLTGASTVNQEVLSESGKRGGWLGSVNRSIHQVARPLMTADEVMRLPGSAKNGATIAAAGELLVFAARLTIRGRQILYFEDPTFAERSVMPAPVRSDTLARPVTAVP